MLTAVLAALLAMPPSEGPVAVAAVTLPVVGADAGQAPVAAAAEAVAEPEPDEEPIEDVESEAARASENASDGGYIYTAELSDADVEKTWADDLASFGSISVGFAEAGRLINGVQMPPGDAWSVVVPEAAWGTQETIDSLIAVAREVHAEFPTAAPLRVNHIGKKDGGYIRPHQSHQSGRDVDLGFFYKPGVSISALTAKREDLMDVAQNWALLRAVVTQTDVQLVLVDRRIQKILYDYALAHGEDRQWLDRLFHAGYGGIVQHARRHRDHFHVRFFAGRSQELGFRVQPLLAKRPGENMVIHRVCKGDTLGRLAARYGSTVKLIQNANGMKSAALSVGRTLNVPLRGPCTQCPQPPLVRVPARTLPPEASAGNLGTSGETDDDPSAALAR